METGSDSAFDRFLEENAAQLTEWRNLGRTNHGLIDCADAGEIAAEAAYIREISTRNGNAEVTC